MPLEYVPSEREHNMLLVRNYAFQKIRSAPNHDSSISWRCQKSRDCSIKCKSTCKTLGDEVVEHPTSHNHAPYEKEEIQFMRMAATTKKRIRSESTKISKIFQEEMAKTVESNAKKVDQAQAFIAPSSK
jgi:hypothetical protein